MQFSLYGSMQGKISRPSLLQIHTRSYRTEIVFGYVRYDNFSCGNKMLTTFLKDMNFDG
jgi:hypothetical protein